MNDLSNLDQHVLRWVSDDFEAPHTIAFNISHDLGHAVNEQEILSSLLRLSHLGLVQPFQYDSDAQQFCPVQFAVLASVAEPWFLAAASAVIR